MHEEYIAVDPKKMMGKPLLKGTRITVEHILEKIAAGESIDQITAAHPRLTREMVLAAMHYAGKMSSGSTGVAKKRKKTD